MSTFVIGDNLRFRYEPLPIGQMVPMVDAAAYAEMLANWPKKELFEYVPRLGNKYSLSEKCHPEQFAAVIRDTPIWSRFDAWIRSVARLNSFTAIAESSRPRPQRNLGIFRLEVGNVLRHHPETTGGNRGPRWKGILEGIL